MIVFLSDLESHGLSESIRDILRDHAIHTFNDLATAMLEMRLRDMLSDDERIAVIEAVWSWIRATFPKPKGGNRPPAGGPTTTGGG